MKNKRQNKGKASSDKNPEIAPTSIALNVADYITTKRILNTGGEELNRWLIFLSGKVNNYKITLTQPLNLERMKLNDYQDRWLVLSNKMIYF